MVYLERQTTKDKRQTTNLETRPIPRIVVVVHVASILLLLALFGIAATTRLRLLLLLALGRRRRRRLPRNALLRQLVQPTQGQSVADLLLDLAVGNDARQRFDATFFDASLGSGVCFLLAFLLQPGLGLRVEGLELWG